MSSVKYQVYADETHHSEHSALVGACTVARSQAVARPGVGFEVEYDGIKVATYCVRNGKLAAWMR